MSNDYDTEQGNWQDYVNPSSGVPRIGISPQGGNGVAQLVNPAPDAPQQRGVIDKLLGLTGERYQLWPEKMVRSAVTLPGDVATGKMATTDPASGEISDELISRVQDLAGLVGGGSLPAAAMSRDIGTLGMVGGKLIQPGANEAPSFFSAMENAVRNAPQDKMSAQQWAGWLKNQPGVKQEELDWAGLPRNGGPVTKQELLDHVSGHGAQIKEVEKTQEIDPDTLEKIKSEYEEAYGDQLTDEESAHEYAAHTGQPFGAKFSDYQLPGGDNYRELLLTLPQKETRTFDKLTPAEKQSLKQEYENKFGEGSLESEHDLREYHDQYMQKDTKPSADYRSSHWDEPNVLVHLRMNDRLLPQEAVTQRPTDADVTQWARDSATAVGSNWDRLAPEQQAAWKERGQEYLSRPKEQPPLKSLHLEEVQSDWHQQGRKQGYKQEVEPGVLKAADEKVTEASDQLRSHLADMKLEPHEIDKALADVRSERIPSWVLGDKNNEHLATDTIDAIRERNELSGTGKVPDAPFKTTWADLALKRAITKAAREGYDAVSWTPGEQQAARYDLSKQIKALQYHRYDDGTYVLRGETTAGGTHNFGDNIPATKLVDYVGKDIADKIVKDEKGAGSLEGADLKVGGEGMKRFYDKMLVDKANNIAKKFGAKVEYKDMGSTVEYTKAPDGTWYPADGQGARVDGPVFEVLPFGKTPDAERHPHAYDAQQTMVLDPDQNSVVGGPFKSSKEAEAWIASKGNKPLKVPVLRLTPKMKDAALRKGMPLFSAGVPFSFTPVDHDPFKDTK